MIVPFFRPMLCLAPDGAASGAAAMPEVADTRQDGTQAGQEAQTAVSAANEADAPDAPVAQKQPEQAHREGDHKHSLPAEPKGSAAHTHELPKAGDPQTPSAEERLVTANARLLDAELRSAAALAGVPKARIPYAVRMAETKGIDLNAEDAAEKIAAAMEKVLSDVPELRSSAGVGTGSVGNFARRTEAIDPDMARIEKNILGQ